MSAENRDLVRSFFEVQDREGRTPAELCSPDFTAHLPGAPTLDFAAFDQREAMFFAAFSNIRHLIDDTLAEGDKVAFRMRIEMAHTGDFMGIPTSGKRVSVVGIGIMRTADGKIAEFWGSPDVMGLMQQIGALPTPGQHASP